MSVMPSASLSLIVCRFQLTELDDTSPIPLQQRVRVREFIEDLLASMLGGSLDNVCVGQIYKNLECKYIHEHSIFNYKSCRNLKCYY